MEKGKVKSIAGVNEGGVVVDLQGINITFVGSSFVGRNRGALKVGDSVWFERVGTTAINIRSC